MASLGTSLMAIFLPVGFQMLNCFSHSSLNKTLMTLTDGEIQLTPKNHTTPGGVETMISMAPYSIKGICSMYCCTHCGLRLLCAIFLKRRSANSAIHVWHGMSLHFCCSSAQIVGLQKHLVH